MISPDDISAKAKKIYPKMRLAWLDDPSLKEFFPQSFPAKWKDTIHLGTANRAVEVLRKKEKGQRRPGYRIVDKHRDSRVSGGNNYPDRIVIDTLDDLVWMAGKQQEFAETRLVVDRVREEFPGLEAWLRRHIRTLHLHAAMIEGLIAVARFFLDNPWPDCYARQIPVSVHTKFVEDHHAVLKEWLDILLPATAIRVDEKKFARRFGLRDDQPHTTVRLLAPELQSELQLPFDEFSAPLRALARLAVREAMVFVVENRLNMQTLPAFARGMAIRGEGKAVTRLRQLEWLADNRIVYWGDIDVEGFAILSSLRSLFPNSDIQSVMMDRETLRCNQEWIVAGHTGPVPPHLTDEELATFHQCAEKCQRLEQEKLPQPYVDEQIARLAAPGSG